MHTAVIRSPLASRAVPTTAAYGTISNFNLDYDPGAANLSWSGNSFTESNSFNSAAGSGGTFNTGTFTASGTVTSQLLVSLQAHSDRKGDKEEVIDEISLQNMPCNLADPTIGFLRCVYTGPDFASKVATAKETVIDTDPKTGAVTTTVYTATNITQIEVDLSGYPGAGGGGGGGGGGGSAATGHLAITGISLVQVVHNWPETPLIAGKKTVARVFIKSVGTNATPVSGVSAVLHRFGEPDPPAFSGPITALPYNGPIPPTAAPDFTEATVNFELPDAWVKTPGSFSLTAEIVPPSGFQDSNPASNTLQRTVALDPPPQGEGVVPGWLLVGYVTIDHQPPGAAAPFTVSTEVGQVLARFAQKVFPVPEGHVVVGRATEFKVPYKKDLKTDDDWQALLDTLSFFFEYWGNFGFDQVLALIPYEPNPLHGGMADTLYANGRGKVAIVMDGAAPALAETAAHEMGHNFGLRHAIKDYVVKGQTICANKAQDDCPLSFWPYTDPYHPIPGLGQRCESNHPQDRF